MKKSKIAWTLITVALLSHGTRLAYALEDSPHEAVEQRRLLLPTQLDGLEAESFLPARPEPDELIQARIQLAHDRKERAKKAAKKEAKRLMQERSDAWEDAFPVVEGKSKEARFINSIAKDSVEIAREADLYPSVLIAQAGLESGWGKSGLTRNYHNLFGIKGTFNGETATLKTWEDIDGQIITIDAGFRAYPSVKASITDYAQLLTNGLRWSPEFYKGTWRSETDSYRDVTAFLQGRYATDTRYTQKLNDLIERYDLTRFDSIDALETDPIVVKPVVEKDSPLTHREYQVKDGESVQLILLKHDLELEAFLDMNELDEARLHVNQVVIIEDEVDGSDLTLSRSLPQLSGDDLLAIKEAVKGGR